MISELIVKCRSYRRFFQEISIPSNDLIDMIDNARLSSSAKNNQSLKYVLSNDKSTNDIIFSCLSWATYFKDWSGPEDGERPSAYIVMLNDSSIAQNYFCDHGIAAQSILLSAVEKGYGGCIIASVNQSKLCEGLSIAMPYQLIQVIALGKPKETVVLEPMGPSGDIRYWRDEKQVHHVPKRSLEEIIIKMPLIEYV